MMTTASAQQQQAANAAHVKNKVASFEGRNLEARRLYGHGEMSHGEMNTKETHSPSRNHEKFEADGSSPDRPLHVDLGQVESSSTITASTATSMASASRIHRLRHTGGTSHSNNHQNAQHQSYSSVQQTQSNGSSHRVRSGPSSSLFAHHYSKSASSSMGEEEEPGRLSRKILSSRIRRHQPQALPEHHSEHDEAGFVVASNSMPDDELEDSEPPMLSKSHSSSQGRTQQNPSSNSQQSTQKRMAKIQRITHSKARFQQQSSNATSSQNNQNNSSANTASNNNQQYSSIARTSSAATKYQKHANLAQISRMAQQQRTPNRREDLKTEEENHHRELHTMGTDDDDDVTLTSVRQLLGSGGQSSKEEDEEEEEGDGASYCNLGDAENSEVGISVNSSKSFSQKALDARRKKKTSVIEEEKSDKERAPQRKGSSLPRIRSLDSEGQHSFAGTGRQPTLQQQPSSLSHLSGVEDDGGANTQPQYPSLRPNLSNQFQGSFDGGRRGPVPTSQSNLNNGNDEGSEASIPYNQRKQQEQEARARQKAVKAAQKAEGVDFSNPMTQTAAGVAAAATIGCFVIGPVGLLVGAAAVGIGVGVMQIPEEQRRVMNQKATKAFEGVSNTAFSASESLSNTCATSYKDSGLSEHVPVDCFSGPDENIAGQDPYNSLDNNSFVGADGSAPQQPKTLMSAPSCDNNFRNEPARVSDAVYNLQSNSNPDRAYNHQQSVTSNVSQNPAGHGIASSSSGVGLDPTTLNPNPSFNNSSNNNNVISSSGPVHNGNNGGQKEVACMKEGSYISVSQIYNLAPNEQPRAWLDVLASVAASYDEKMEAMEEILILAKDKSRARLFVEEGILDSIMWTLTKHMETSNPEPEEIRAAKLAAEVCLRLGKAYCAAMHTDGDLMLMSLYERGSVPEERQLAQMLAEVPFHVRVKNTSGANQIGGSDDGVPTFALTQMSLQQAEEFAKLVKQLADGQST